MGMAASQARLLSITARISDNELKQQSIAYSKQRLSDNSEQINDQYLEALDKTKYQILTGYNQSEACYCDISYNQITGCNTVACGKQYLVKDNKGKVLVSQAVANAFKNGNGDFNKFLKNVGNYTQSNLDISAKDATSKIHEAWDKYLASVGKSIDDFDSQHILDFGFTSFSADPFDGYATFATATGSSNNGNPVALFRDENGYYKNNYNITPKKDTTTGDIICGYEADDGTWYQIAGVHYDLDKKKYTYDDFTDENGELIEYDNLYADSTGDPTKAQVFEEQKNYLTPSGVNSDGDQIYKSSSGETFVVTTSSKALNYEGTTTAQRELYDYALSITEAYYNNANSHSSSILKYDAQMVNYYKNIFNEMRSCGYTTIEANYNTDTKRASTHMKDPEWFVNQVKSGKLVLAYYSTTENSFVNTSLDDDESITEKEDKSAIAVAEQVYQSKMDNIERQDKQFDLQLNKLESEHNALQTEYEAVYKVISKNVDTSFKTFNG